MTADLAHFLLFNCFIIGLFIISALQLVIPRDYPLSDREVRKIVKHINIWLIDG